MDNAQVLRILLDTNVLISAILFGGVTSQLVNLWQGGAILPLITRPILEEYLRALAYPKFQLTDREIKLLIEEDLLPFVEVVAERAVAIPKLEDHDDEKFLVAAISGKAHFLLTGDQILLQEEKVGECVITTPGEFLRSR